MANVRLTDNIPPASADSSAAVNPNQVCAVNNIDTTRMSAAELNLLLEEGEYSNAAQLIKENVSQIWSREEFVKYIQVLVLAEEFKYLIKLLRSYSRFASEVIFEHAYTLYRLGQFKAALTLIATSSCDDPRFAALKGQISYRLNDLGGASKVYEEMLKTAQDKEEHERVAVNYLACQVSKAQICGHYQSGKLDEKLVRESPECQFNVSLCFAANSDWKVASELLHSPMVAIRNNLELEGIMEEAIHTELASLKAQFTLIKHRLGEVGESPLSQGGNTTNEVILSWNQAVRSDSPGSSKTCVELLKPRHKLSIPQKGTVRFNLALCLYREGKWEAATKILRKLLKQKSTTGSLELIVSVLLFNILRESGKRGHIRQLARKKEIIHNLYLISSSDFNSLKKIEGGPMVSMLAVLCQQLLSQGNYSTINEIMHYSGYNLEVRAHMLLPRLFWELSQRGNAGGALAGIRGIERLYGQSVSEHPVVGICSKYLAALN